MTVLPSEATYYGLSEDIKKAKEVEKKVVLDKLIDKALHAHEALQHTTAHTSQSSTTPNVTPADASGPTSSGGKKDKKSKKTPSTTTGTSSDKDSSTTKSTSFPITITRKHTHPLTPSTTTTTTHSTETSTWTMPEIYNTTTLIEIKSKIWKQLLPNNNDRELDPSQVTIEYNHTILLDSDLKSMSELGISSNSILYIITMSAYVIRTVDNECISIPYLSPSCTVYSLRERIVQANAGIVYMCIHI